MAKASTRRNTPKLDFAFEKYKLDRSHELELNKATHGFEQESLRILVYLNGGAATAYVGLMGKNLLAAHPLVAVGAVGSWAVGLLFAASALWSAYSAQVNFTQAYHARRRAEEKRRFAGDVSRAMVTDPKMTIEDYERKADGHVASGRVGIDAAKQHGARSVVLFCLGLAFALFSAINL